MQIVKIDVEDGLGEIEVAINSYAEISRLIDYLEESKVAIATTQAIKEQQIETVYQYLNQWKQWESCTSEQYRLKNEWGKKTRVLFTRIEAITTELENQ